jgi:hypothetical protein
MAKSSTASVQFPRVAARAAGVGAPVNTGNYGTGHHPYRGHLATVTAWWQKIQGPVSSAFSVHMLGFTHTDTQNLGAIGLPTLDQSLEPVFW